MNRYRRMYYMAGDPGLFSFLKKGIRGVAKIAGGALGLGGGGGGTTTVQCPAPVAQATQPPAFAFPQMSPYSFFGGFPGFGGGFGGGGFGGGFPGFYPYAGDWRSTLSGLWTKYAPQIQKGFGSAAPGSMPEVQQWARAHPGLMAAATGGAGFLLGGAAGAGIGGALARRAYAGPRPTKAGGMTMRRRPRMQVTNTRALKRALRRTRGFAKIARQVLATSKSFKTKPRFGRRKRAA
jgi:hypothetical protein